MEIKLSKGSIILTKDMIVEMLGLKNEGLDVLEDNPNRDDEMVRSWKQKYGDAKEIKPADVRMRLRKSEEADLNFKLNFIVLFTSIMGNFHQKGRTVDSLDFYRRRPPTKVWTTENLSEREAKELNCGGFGPEELEEDFVDEEGDPIPNNIEGYIWMLNNYVKNITKERKRFKKMLTAAKHMFPGNVNLIGFADKYINSLKCTSGGFRAQRNEEVEVGVSDIGVNERTPGSGKDLKGLTTNSFVDVVVDTTSLSGRSRSQRSWKQMIYLVLV
ncbi:hypothetical protein Tco_1241377 [Tanacetum coccineum]